MVKKRKKYKNRGCQIRAELLLNNSDNREMFVKVPQTLGMTGWSKVRGV
jgi:hypothetical protein